MSSDADVAEAPAPTRRRRERTLDEERAFNLAMSVQLHDRGFHEYARSYELMAGVFLHEDVRAANLRRSRVARDEARRGRG